MRRWRLGHSVADRGAPRRERHGPREFDVDFFAGFSVVLQRPRQTVAASAPRERLCLAAAVPLIDSRTAGLLGQVGGGPSPMRSHPWLPFPRMRE